MKILAIVVEYNPMHNGHIYQINQAKKEVCPDYTIVIMSGNFTQQGNISVIDKFTKASLAVGSGVDLVLELPTIYATSSAEYFAKGAINILNNLNCITHLAFGAECDDINRLTKIARILNEKQKDIIQFSKDTKDKNLTSAKAYSTSLKNFLNEDELEILRKPNNILAIQYLRNISPSITPVLIARKSVEHNSDNIEGTFASSTKIRELLSKDEFSKIEMLVPNSVYSSLKNINMDFMVKYWHLLKYEIIKLGPQKLKNIHEVGEGLENRIYSVACKTQSFDEFISKLSTKRYTLGRLKRICNNILLNITSEKFMDINSACYARVLKVNDKKTDILKILGNNTSIPIIASIKDTLSISRVNNSSVELDTLATKIHNLLFNNNFNDYINIK